ncbi:MAG: hypothetical protein ABWY00_12170, partial [Dongiaceae bacterium]
GCMTSSPPPRIDEIKADGKSIETAVPIIAANAVHGHQLEEGFIKAKYPSMDRRAASLVVVKGKIYDLVDISVDEGGERQRVYFDVTDIYGIREY